MRWNTLFRAFVLASIAAIAPSSAKAQVTTTPQALDRAVGYLASQLLAIGEAMPEDHFNSSPNKGTSTFAQQLKHVAINNYLSAAIVSQQPEPSVVGNAPDTKTKEAVLAYLRASFDDVRKAIAALDEGTAIQPVKSGDRMVLPLGVVIGIIAHGWNHYGQTTQYLRAVGVVPPASR
ncbi:MAG: DinB family protein [Gemmatimonadaceae bacterium]